MVIISSNDTGDSNGKVIVDLVVVHTTYFTQDLHVAVA